MSAGARSRQMGQSRAPEQRDAVIAAPGAASRPPAPPGPAWAGRRYLGAGGWGRAGARGALSARINEGARRGRGRRPAGARGAAPQAVLPCGALSTLPERARSSPELRPAQLPANLRSPVRLVLRPSPKLCSNPHTHPPGSLLNPRSASVLQAGGSQERAQSALPPRPRPCTLETRGPASLKSS